MKTRFNTAIVVGETSTDYYKNITIKGIYDDNPAVKYPMITIEEIENTEYEEFSTSSGEKVSRLAYQIDCYSRNTDLLQATESAMLIGRVVNEVLGGQNYKMTRVGTPALIPLIEDNTVIRYSLRYRCVLDLTTHTIYKN